MSINRRDRIAVGTWIAAVLLVMGCSPAPGPQATGAGSAGDIPDTDLSYRHEPLDTESATPGTRYTDIEPGDSQLLERSFENAPPIIPHSLTDLLPITRARNDCLECHHPDMAEDFEATAMPPTHFYDIRRDRQLDDANPANYNCTQCHVPKADAPELVKNTFQPQFRGDARRHSSNLFDVRNEGVEED